MKIIKNQKQIKIKKINWNKSNILSKIKMSLIKMTNKIKKLITMKMNKNLNKNKKMKKL